MDSDDEMNEFPIADIGKKPGLEIWRINRFRLEPVPKKEYGEFYIGDAYVCMNTKYGQWDIHFWLGDNATPDEIGAAAITAVQMDQALGGFPVQHREVQNHESSLFLSYFPNGIRYVMGGYDSGYHHVEGMFANFKPRLFHCKGKRNVRCTQVDCKKQSLNLGDVFILDLGPQIYVWMPPKSGRLERIKGMARAKNIAYHERNGASTVEILDSDWDTDETFWSHFGGLDAVKTIESAKDDDENYWKRTTEQMTLWRVSDASGTMKLTKIAQGELKRSMLDTKKLVSFVNSKCFSNPMQKHERKKTSGGRVIGGVPSGHILGGRGRVNSVLRFSQTAAIYNRVDAFILDAVSGGVYVWVGKGCTMNERGKAMIWGEQFLREKKLPQWTQVTRVLETAEPAAFTQWFGEWEDTKKKKAFEPRLFQVSDESGKMLVEEIANFDQESLDGDDVMILDALNIIYVWVGAGANQDEKKGALNTAKKYLEQGNLPRHKKTSIETIYQGKETPTFKKFFKSWNDELFENDERSVENMRKLLFSDI